MRTIKSRLITPVSITLKGFPFHLFHKAAIFSVGRLVGNPLKINSSIIEGSCPGKAHICMELDLMKPHLEHVYVEAACLVKNLKSRTLANKCMQITPIQWLLAGSMETLNSRPRMMGKPAPRRINLSIPVLSLVESLTAQNHTIEVLPPTSPSIRVRNWACWNRWDNPEAHGIPVDGFSSLFSYKTNMEVEAHDLLIGIQLCIDKGLLNVFIEADSLILCKMIHGHIDSNPLEA
ncbi:hypothetical protein ACH5RR_000865 [Cinchona calisaya]|uniref:RNase H type-1 domain-containing protein n=1 Tax=Cinchona calisaya TaxID=153742 RepID=A0ABD3B2X6_9GENT